jgi:hypothetical protein
LLRKLTGRLFALTYRIQGIISFRSVSCGENGTRKASDDSVSQVGINGVCASISFATAMGEQLALHSFFASVGSGRRRGRRVSMIRIILFHLMLAVCDCV